MLVFLEGFRQEGGVVELLGDLAVHVRVGSGGGYGGRVLQGLTVHSEFTPYSPHLLNLSCGLEYVKRLPTLTPVQMLVHGHPHLIISTLYWLLLHQY